MQPVVIGAWVFVTAYIFVGIEDVGSQVEQPLETSAPMATHTTFHLLLITDC